MFVVEIENNCYEGMYRNMEKAGFRSQDNTGFTEKVKTGQPLK